VNTSIDTITIIDELLKEGLHGRKTAINSKRERMHSAEDANHESPNMANYQYVPLHTQKEPRDLRRIKEQKIDSRAAPWSSEKYLSCSRGARVLR
jgi:hypothetical protein